MRGICCERETNVPSKPEGTDITARQSTGAVNPLFRTQNCCNYYRVAAVDSRGSPAAVAGTGTSGYSGRIGDSQSGVRMGQAADSKVARQMEEALIARLWLRRARAILDRADSLFSLISEISVYNWVEQKLSYKRGRFQWHLTN